MINVDNPPTRVRGKQASEYLQKKFGIVRTPATLAKLRSTGGGPVYQKDNRWPLYTPEQLDCWAEHILSRPMRSTSDTATVSTRSATGDNSCLQPRGQSQHDQTKPDQDRAPSAGADTTVHHDDQSPQASRTQR
jgi:hypothetical protein